MSARPPAATDALFGAPLGEFTRERDATASRLREAGRTAEAAAVKRLRKPSVPLWVVNQLGRRDLKAVTHLIDAVEHLRRAQLGRDDMTEATTAERGALRSLLDRARRVLSDAGLVSSRLTLARIERTLLGAAADRQAREDLRHGRLTQEYAPPSFDVFSEAPVEPHETPIRKPTRKAEGRGARADRRVQHEDSRRAREAERIAKVNARAEARRFRQLEREAVQHERDAQKTAMEAEKLRQRLAEVDLLVNKQRRMAEQARRAVQRSRGA